MNAPRPTAHGPRPTAHFLHVIQRYHPYVGGSELYFQTLSEHFAARGNQVTVYTTDAWDLEHFWAAGRRRMPDDAPHEHRGVTIERFPVRRPPGWRLGYPVTRRLMTHLSEAPVPGRGALLRFAGRFSPWVPGLERALRDVGARYDLVHTANIALEGPILAAERYCRRRDVPLVVTPFVHLGEPGDRRVRKYYAMRHQLAVLRRAAAVVVQTRLEGRFLAARGVPESRIHPVGAGVEPAAVTGGDGAAFRARHGIAGPIVTSIGAMAFDKGTPHVVEAMRRLWHGGGPGADATLVLAGSTVLSHFAAFFAALPERDQARCRLLGFITPEEKRDLLAATDVFAMPSRTDTFGIVFLEAWCCGIPVIGARAGGLPDVIDDGNDGLLVPFADPRALEGAIRDLLADPELAARLGARGRAKTLERYTWARVNAAFERVYEGAMGTRRGEHGTAPPRPPTLGGATDANRGGSPQRWGAGGGRPIAPTPVEEPAR